MEIRTDRVGLLLDQLVESRNMSAERLSGTAAEEFLWEPYEGMWSVRRRDEAVTPRAFGKGDWVLDHDTSISPFDPGPLSTIAWRIAHLTSGFAGRWEYTFGARSADPLAVVDFSPDPDVALPQLWGLVDRWAESVAAMTDEQLDVPGFGTYPYGLDAEIPFIGIVWWTNRELIHHLAEAALLRDLYTAAHRS